MRPEQCRNDEHRVECYLRSLGYTVQFEPDANCPPDFLVNDEIAVEVRRLNNAYGLTAEQIGEINTKRKGFECALDKYLGSYGESSAGPPWLISYKYRWHRPCQSLPGCDQTQRRSSSPEHFGCGIPREKELPKVLGPIIDELSSAPTGLQGKTFKINERLTLKATRGVVGADYEGDVPRFALCSVPGTFVWVVRAIVDNLRVCIREKSEKITRHCDRHGDRFREWWLILVNHIAPGSGLSAERLKEANIDIGVFQRVMVLNPLTLRIEFELP